MIINPGKIPKDPAREKEVIVLLLDGRTSINTFLF